VTPRINLDAVLARAAGPSDPPVPDTALALLRLLREMHVTLRLDGNRLYVDITAGNVTRAMLEALRQHKEAVHDITEWLEERCGLLEYDGGLARAEAEQAAWTQLEECYEVMHQPRDSRRRD